MILAKPIQATTRLAIAILLASLPGSAFAQSMDACRSQCTRDRDNSNASCPLPSYEYSQERDDCMRGNQQTYLGCVSICPPPESSPMGSPVVPPELAPTITLQPGAVVTPEAAPLASPATTPMFSPAPVSPATPGTAVPQPAPQRPSGY